jgi:16S rRNA (cytidine1402-2'-O)-methyltransferase
VDAGSVAAPGTLYVVATPLGHLGDLTARAREILRVVPIVAAEDTRHTRNLLAHVGAKPRLLSFHAHSPPTRVAHLIEALKAGSDVALVSDAGTPAISDPGASLVRLVRNAGLPVVPIPGASAVAVALSAAGLPADRFLFLGFLPRKGGERRRLIERATTEEWTTVIFEAPPRLSALLAELAAVADPDRRAVVCRELTKVHEEIREGSLAELADHYAAAPPRGEITVLVEGAGRARKPPPDLDALRSEARDLLGQGLSRRSVVGRLTESSGVPRNEIYRLVMELE